MSADGNTEITEISRRQGECYGECTSHKSTTTSSKLRRRVILLREAHLQNDLRVSETSPNLRVQRRRPPIADRLLPFCGRSRRARPFGEAALLPLPRHRISGKRHSCRFSGTTRILRVAATRESPSLCLWKQLEQLQAQLSFGARANSPAPMNYPLHTGASRAGNVARAPSPLLQGRSDHTTLAAHRLRHSPRRYGNSTFTKYR